MIFNNPFFTIQVVFMIIALIYAQAMDGQPMAPRRHSLSVTMWSVAINFILLYGAVIWAQSH